MRKTYPALTVSLRATLPIFIALVVGAIALVSLGTRPAESQPTPAQPLYEVHDLGTLAGGSHSTAQGINDAGKVVGASATSGDAEQHAFLYSDGVMSDLGTLEGLIGRASSINNAGQVAGTAFSNETFVERGFLYSDGVMSELGTLGGPNSAANAINDAGKVVGASTLSGDSDWRAFLYSGGQMRDLGTLGGSVSAAADINDAGKVVGYSSISGDTKNHAFLYSGGRMTDLGTPEDSIYSSYATAINNDDQVVGRWEKDANFTESPFLYSAGQMSDLNTLIPQDSGWELRYVTDINDNGLIVGQGRNPDGQDHAYLLTPSLTPPSFDGFYAPVDNLPTLNKAKPGKTIPIRFSLGGDKGLDIFESGYPKSETVLCDSTAPVDGIEETVTGNGGLSYNAITDTYEYAWATSSSWSGTCRQFVMKLKDGTVQRANFSFR